MEQRRPVQCTYKHCPTGILHGRVQTCALNVRVPGLAFGPIHMSEAAGTGLFIFSQKDCAMSSYACVKVLEAAAIGVPHPKWTERPLLVVVPHPGQNPSKDELLSYFQVRSAYRQPTVLHPTKELFMPFLMVPGPLAGSQPDVHQHDPIGCGHLHLITSGRSASVAR